MFLSKTPSKLSFGLFAIASLIADICSAADNPLWEPAKVVAVEQVSTPAKEPDPSCRSVPKGATPPARCRPSYLQAEHYWVVTVDVGNKRFAVRPMRAPGALYLLNQGGNDYVDPQLTAPSSIEAAIVSDKSIRLRAEGGRELYAMVESQKLLSTPVAAVKIPQPAAAMTTGSKIVLLENNDFRDLEAQDIKPKNIGDGVVLYSFPGDSSPVRPGSKTPVFLLLADNEAASVGTLELARLQVGKGVRELASARSRSASSIPITITQVSATLRKFTATEPLPPGEYVILLENSSRGYLFTIR